MGARPSKPVDDRKQQINNLKRAKKEKDMENKQKRDKNPEIVDSNDSDDSNESVNVPVNVPVKNTSRASKKLKKAHGRHKRRKPKGLKNEEEPEEPEEPKELEEEPEEPTIVVSQDDVNLDEVTGTNTILVGYESGCESDEEEDNDRKVRKFKIFGSNRIPRSNRRALKRLQRFNAIESERIMERYVGLETICRIVKVSSGNECKIMIIDPWAVAYNMQNHVKNKYTGSMWYLVLDHIDCPPIKRKEGLEAKEFFENAVHHKEITELDDDTDENKTVDYESSICYLRINRIDKHGRFEGTLWTGENADQSLNRQIHEKFGVYHDSTMEKMNWDHDRTHRLFYDYDEGMPEEGRKFFGLS